MGKRIAGLIALVVVVAACSKKDDAKPEATAAVTNAALDAGAGASDMSDASAASATSAPDDVEPVYAIEPNAPPMPLAQRLCETLSEMPEKKRAACCATTPGIVVTSECTRMLSAALRHDAIALAEADVDACTAAFERTLSGCDWVGPFPPGPPAECLGIVRGKIPAGQRCRSSLECAGHLRCAGVGPTTPGTCAPPKATGELCGGTVDTLAGYVRQADLDARHPECAEGDRCIKHKCAAPAVENASCQTTSDCAAGLECIAKKCARHALPKEGEACPGGVCEGDLQCIRATCTARKPTGESCTSDFECKGGCLKTSANARAKGTCGPRCDIR